MDLIPQLVRRLVQARAKGHLEDLLRKAKERPNQKKATFRVTGTAEELENSTQAAVIDGFLSDVELASLVDEIEEWGGQHIFLFELTDAGKKQLTPEAVRAAFTAAPKSPTPAQYADEPQKRTVCVERDSGPVVKQLYTAEYWELDQERSSQKDNERIQVWTKQHRRAINLLRINFKDGTVAIHIDRVRDRNDEKLALAALDAFLASVVALKPDDHFRPIPVAAALQKIVAETAGTGETFMAVDSAHDPIVEQSISSRRESTKGQDVRMHPSYNLNQAGWDRRALHIYWTWPWPPPSLAAGLAHLEATDSNSSELSTTEKKKRDLGVYSIISALYPEADGTIIELSKVYVSAKVSPEAVRHVLGRIRHFAA